MRTHAVGKSDIGRQRSNNEDAFLIDDDLGLYVVCDGMGGHEGGEIAARESIAAVAAHVAAQRSRLEGLLRGEGNQEDFAAIAVNAIASAAARVRKTARSSRELRGMGCTLTMALVAGDLAVMAHVGDSRLYLCRDGATEQLSTDHTVANDLYRRGLLTRAQARSSPYTSSLTRFIGSDHLPDPETLLVDLEVGDRLLLCSDGLSAHVDELAELGTELSDGRPVDVINRLVSLANERGGSDNITAVLATVERTDDDDEVSGIGAGAACLEALRRNPLLAEVAFANLLRLDRAAQRRDFAAGEIAIGAGTVVDGVSIVVAGRFEREARERTTVLRPGDAVHETALLVPRASGSILRCTTPGSLWTLSREAFRRMCRRRPWLGVALLDHLGRLAATPVDDAP